MDRQTKEQQYAALQELSKRKLSYYTYNQYDIWPAKHHELLISYLERVERGEIKRLMVFMPPGSAKSTYCSMVFPGWYIGRNPKNSIISASYGEGLAVRFGKRVRDQVSSKYYPFKNVSLSESTKAKGEWETNHGGEYYAGSVGGSVTGRRADIGIIDDPIKGRKEADSIVVRDTAWEWYRADFFTRLKPDGAIIIILTRWHEDDLVGRILYWDENEKRAKIPESYDYSSGGAYAYDGEWWDILSLPAIAEENDQLGRKPGEALWPEYGFTKEKYSRIMITQGPRNWNSLYQQKPRPDEGSYFTNDMIRRYHFQDLDISNKRFYGASDYAVGTKEENDETVHGIAAIDPTQNIWIVDLFHGRVASNVWAQQQIDMIKKWKPVKWAAEKGQIEKSVGPFLITMMREQKVYCYIQPYASSVDKQQRAQSIRGRASMGYLYIPYCDWGNWLVDQMLAFPAGAYDDGVDFLSKLGQMLDEMSGPPIPQDVDDAERKRYIFGEDQIKKHSKKEFKDIW